MNSVQPLWSLKSPKLSLGSSYSYSLRPSVSQTNLGSKIKRSKFGRRFLANRARLVVCGGFLLPVDPWAPNVDSQSIAPPLFALSLFPYIGFLYYITKSKSAPKLTLFGFYFLLAFVGATSEFLALFLSLNFLCFLWGVNMKKVAIIPLSFPLFRVFFSKESHLSYSSILNPFANYNCIYK